MPTSPVQIRRAGESDCAALADLIVELRREEGRSAPDRAAVLATAASAVKDPSCAVSVAESSDGVIGFIVVHWIPFPMIAGTEAYISDLIVSVGQRGSGIGQCLIDAVEDEARSRGCVRLMLNNRMAAPSFQRSFYPKLGFRHRDEHANFVKPLR